MMKRIMAFLNREVKISMSMFISFVLTWITLVILIVNGLIILI